jgi:hypothetical protein
MLWIRKESSSLRTSDLMPYGRLLFPLGYLCQTELLFANQTSAITYSTSQSLSLYFMAVGAVERRE